MTSYVFDESPAEHEVERMRLIEQALDAYSIGLLQSTGVKPGWTCLEVGAGAGSIALWMGRVVGATGRVVAIDTNTSHIRHLTGPQYTLMQCDIVNASLECEFDLVHCRYVLIHNRHPESLLKKCCSLLKPGGLLIVEEPDFTSAKALNTGNDISHRRVSNAICRMFEQRGLNPAYGLALPRQTAAEGLAIQSVEARLHLDRGGGPLARMMAASTKALRDKYIATGEASPEDVDMYIADAHNERVWALYYATVSVIAAQHNRARD